MARWTILFGKKRGERRTGSNTMGRAALGLFAAVFFTAGMISLAFILLKLSIPEWRVNRHFVPTTCEVLETRATEDSDGLTRPEILIRYTVDEHPFTVWSHYDIAGAYRADPAYAQKILAEFEPGAEYECWYDPKRPDTVVLARGYTWFAWLMLLVPAAFISIGGGGLLYAVLTWGKSSERIAATAQHPPGLDFFLPSQSTPPQPFPFVPDPQNLNDSPGTFLTYRLPAGTGGWSTAAIAVVTALWNLGVVVFARMAVQSFQEGEPDWWLTIFLVPLVAVGLFCLGLLARSMLIATGIGPTLVEISAHPLVPGGAYHVYMSQTGRLAVKSLDVKLICEETATYRQGTNTRRATRRVYEQVLVSRDSFKIGQGLPFEARAELQVPADAMHSFKANHNRIDWKIVVNGAVAGWPGFVRGFPVVVRPRAATGGAA